MLQVPDLPGLRPTPDRVRETVFNWLGQRLDGLHCLDVFAGTGAMGFEAASRGAASVTMLEHAQAAVDAIRASIGRLRAEPIVELLEGDALGSLDRLAHAGRRFDVVFVDPPFGATVAGGPALLDAVLGRLPRLLADDAILYVETDRALTAPVGFELLRAERAGAVFYHLIRIARGEGHCSEADASMAP